MAARHEVGMAGKKKERGRLARNAALARVTLTLALSHERRGDPLAGVWGWFRMAGLIGSHRGGRRTRWIPAFAGMTARHEVGNGQGRRSAGVPARNAAIGRGGALTLALSP